MELLIYAIKASAGLIALYALYWSTLRWHTYFQFNRFYLLTATLLALGVPFVTLTETAPLPLHTPTAIVEPLPAASVSIAMPSPHIQPEDLLVWGYMAGILLMLGRLVWQLVKLMRLIQSAEHIEAEGYTLVRMQNTALSSFSFLNYLVINPKDLSSPPKIASDRGESPVITHELVHIRQRHSWDLLWLELLHVFLWFNPVLFFYKRSLKEIHEFIADDLATHGDRLTYARALAGYALGVSPQVLTNNFFDISQLKTRIAMLTKTRSPRRVLGRYLFALPLLGLMIALLAARQVVYEPTSKEEITVKGKVTAPDGTALPGVEVVTVNSEMQTNTNTNNKGDYQISANVGSSIIFSFPGFQSQVFKVEKNTTLLNVRLNIKSGTTVATVFADGTLPKIEEILDTNLLRKLEGTDPLPAVRVVGKGHTPAQEMVFWEAEEPASFVGGLEALGVYLDKNLKYPAAARRANVSGTVYVQFVVSADGDIREPKIHKGIGFGCDEEALRVVLNMPKWNPGRQNGKPVAVQFNLPIRFELETPPTTEDDPKKAKPVQIVIGANPDNSSPNPPMNLSLQGYKGPPPLFILDDKEITQELLKGISPEDIDNISVLKNEKATAIYGEKGKNGVVVITTKTHKMVMKGNFTASQNGISDDDKIYTVVEQQPEYKGGMRELYRFIKDNLVYPEAAKIEKIQGKVFLTFTVRKDGTLADIQVLKGLGYGCDAAAIKVLSKSKPWIPAMDKGKVVNCRFNLPVEFKLP